MGRKGKNSPLNLSEVLRVKEKWLGFESEREERVARLFEDGLSFGS